ncbi:MAG: RNA 2',3'-cyclic phosphodiesterase [bacterium]
MTLRLFIAVELSPEVKQAVADAIARLRKGIQFTPAHPAWVSPDAMHLTLKFLGATSEEDVPRLNEILTESVNNEPEFEMSVEGLGVFPSPHRPSVLWMGIKEGKANLARLAARIDQRVESLGFEREKRDYHPHLTLARIKALRGVEAMMEIVNSHKHLGAGHCRITRVVLFKSELRPEGALHTPIAFFPLAPPIATG